MVLKLDVDRELSRLYRRILPLVMFVNEFATRLPQPLWYDSSKGHWGYRYGQTDVRHFCLLKLCRAASGLNACIILARFGYIQELNSIIRIVIDCKANISFVLSGCENGKVSAKAEAYITKYFSDYRRDNPTDFLRPNIKQLDLHKHIGEDLKIVVKKTGREKEFSGFEPSEAYSNIYLTFSNYVHCRYPETMDMYGGIPPMFHLYRMRGTPKYKENIENIEEFINSIQLSVELVDKTFGLNIFTDLRQVDVEVDT